MQTDAINLAGKTLVPSLPRAAGLAGDTGIMAPHRATGTPGAGGAASAPFSGVFQEAMSNLQGLERQATSTVEGLVQGHGVDVHAAMIATQKSDLAFEMALAVRGKMVSAYQTMMGVQF